MSLKNTTPEGWLIKKVHEISNITTGSADTQDRAENGKYPFFVRAQKIERINTYARDCEAVLTAGDGVGVGKVFHYVKGKFDYHQRVYAIHDFDIEGRFFYEFFRAFFGRRVAQFSAKGSVDSIRMEFISEMPIAHPEDRTEQQKIAEVLSTVDEAIELTQRAIEKQTSIKAGLMQELLTKGLDEHGNIRSETTHQFKDSKLGRIPVEWVCISCEEMLRSNILLEIQDGNHGEVHPKSSDFVSYGIPFIMASDIASGQIDFNSCKFISKKQYKSLRIGFSKKGDILLSHKASIGFVAQVEVDEIMLTPQVTYYRPNREKISNDFLIHSLRGLTFQLQIENLSKQSTRSYIGILQQRKLHIAFPLDTKEQDRISTIISSTDKVIKDLEVKKSKLESIKRGLMAELLTGKTRVTSLLSKESDA